MATSVTPAPTPMPEPTELLEARAEAIRLSGWGRPFRLVQPYNLAFWVWLVLALIGAWQFVHLFTSYVPLASTGLTIGVVVIAAYAVALFVFFRTVVDRYTRLPPLLLAAAILWGGLAATYAIAITGNDANITLIQKLVGQGFAHDWSAAISAPFVEESSKAAGFLLLLTLAPTLLQSTRSALVTGAFIGLGFQVFEDLLYGANSAAGGFYANQAGSVLDVAGLRLATGVISHPAYSALCCVGVLYLLGSPAVRRNVPKGLGFIALGVLGHGLWDGAGAIGDSGPGTVLAMIGALLLAIVALTWAFKASAPDDQRWMAAILAPEVASGAVTADEAAAAAGRRNDRRRFTHAGKGHGHHRDNAHALEATLDLAHELAVSEGQDTPAVDHARSELTRVRPDQARAGENP